MAISFTNLGNFASGSTQQNNWTQSITTSSDGVLIVVVANRNNVVGVPVTSTGVTFNGVAMTQLSPANTTNGSDTVSQTWYRQSSPGYNVTANIVAQFSGNCTGTWQAFMVRGVGTITVGTLATAAGSSTGPTVAVSSAVGGKVLGAIQARTCTKTLTQEAGQTLLTQSEGNAGSSSAQELWTCEEAGAASVTISGTLSATDQWVAGGLSFTESAPVGVSLDRRRRAMAVRHVRS